MNASMNETLMAITLAASQDNKRNNHTHEVISLQDDDGSVKVRSQGLSFHDKACTSTNNTLSKHNSIHKNCVNKSALLLHILLAFLSLSLPVVQAHDRPICARRPALHTIHHQGCTPKILLVPVCLGTCRSYSMTDDRELTSIHAWCNSCQETGFVNRNVTLRCSGPNGEPDYMDSFFIMKIPTGCMCRPCASLPEIPALELS